MSTKLIEKNDQQQKNYVYYGPIRCYFRRKHAPTLSTGRRSKFEQVSDEERLKRDIRRERNRLLAKKLKEKREKILTDLLEQVKQLEENEFLMQNLINELQSQKNNLILQLDNFNQESFDEQFDDLFDLPFDLLTDDTTSIDSFLD
ncbi:unnamed protein product [Adineta ricciae]|uniref:BZIP domain-containing protein n=1 Tax=Adineta ricciae TaxID=249248 RepID=A0A813ZSS7_ADIRI|nr:unnamed protein product [Adineta ricciae]CAF1367260.1 unnamed protein product [Adineta ricciae]